MPRKSFTLFFIILLFAYTVTNASGANFNAIAGKYVMAAQKKDIKALLDMHASVQENVAKIKKRSPRILWDAEIKKAYDWEEKYVSSDNRLELFTPDMKWKLLESKKNTIYPKNWGTFYSLFIGVAYDNPNTAPLVSGKPLRRSIFVINFSTNGQYYNKLEMLEDQTSYWQLPLKISNLKHTYNGNKLIISFTIDGGKPNTTGGTPPYVNVIKVNNASQYPQKALLLNEYFDQSKYDIAEDFMTGGTAVEYKPGRSRSGGEFAWPPDTFFPIQITIGVTDSSSPQLTDMANILIEDGQVAANITIEDGKLAGEDKDDYGSGNVKKTKKKKR